MDDSTSEQPAEDTVHKLCNEAGLLVAFETIGTLYQCAYLEQEVVSGEEALSSLLQWEVVGYGVPVIMANKNGVALCLADVESGSKLCSFTISPVSQYTVIEDDFHIFTKPSGCFGIAFSNSTVAGKFFSILNRTVTCTYSAVVEEDAEEGMEPLPKRRHEDERDDKDVGEDELDGVFKKTNKNKLTISEPDNFHHLSHIGKDDDTIIQLTQLFSWTDTLKRKESDIKKVISIPCCSNTESTSFEEGKILSSPAAAPPLPPPPPAVIPPPPIVVFKKKKDASNSGIGKDLSTSLIEELKRGVILRPVSDDMTSYSNRSSGRSLSSLQEELKGGVVLKSITNNFTMTLPKPRRTRENEKLLFEIQTFRRKKLRNISTIDFPSTRSPFEENSLEQIMKRGLAKMFKKVTGSMENLNLGSVDSKGEDSFGGLFSKLP